MKLTKEQCEYEFSKLNVDTQRWIVCMIHELNGAIEKHPNWPKDQIHAAAIVAEESGELIRAALQYKYEKGRLYDMHNEAIQTGTMALRFLLNAPEHKFKG